ncbi:hypothetical protein [Tritonibacter scottomollicae]|uniref:hypothetical protein n=1 Tax=Tritonibacter scottomollicae TaxID=483013 RepID=UPI003AA9D6F5
MKRPALKSVMVTWLLLGGMLPAAAEDRASTPETNEEALLTYLGGDGCVIGPHSAGAATAAGFDGDALAALGARLLADGSAEKQGDWTVLGPEVCTIRFPDVTSELTLNSPEVQDTLRTALSIPSLDEIQWLNATTDTLREEGLSLRNFEEQGIAAQELRAVGIDPDALAKHMERPRCLLGGSTELTRALQQTRGWSQDRSFRAAVALIASGLKQGELTFFSDDILVTPPGFMLTAPACWTSEEEDAIARSHAMLEQHFDRFVRARGAETSCDTNEVSGALMGREAYLLWTQLAGREPENVWIGFEVFWGAIGAGWFEGASFTEKGTPRPPLCRF